MPISRRVPIGLAGLVAAPGVLLATAACLYIVYSIATETWYRQTFLGYGVMLATLYAVFVAGVVAAAFLAIGPARPAVPRSRRLAWVACIAGVVAACVLEFELWDEAERVLPLGLLFGPFVGWAIAFVWLRKLPPPPPPEPQWEDTRT